MIVDFEVDAQEIYACASITSTSLAQGRLMARIYRAIEWYARGDGCISISRIRSLETSKNDSSEVQGAKKCASLPTDTD